MIELIKIERLEKIFHFTYYNKKIEMSFCELLSLRNKVNVIDITSHFYGDSNRFGIEIVTLCNLKHILIMNTKDILFLRIILEKLFAPQELVPTLY